MPKFRLPETNFSNDYKFERIFMEKLKVLQKYYGENVVLEFLVQVQKRSSIAS